MTQRLSNLTSSYWPAALLFLLVLLLMLLSRAMYRYRQKKKRQLASSENHPAIPQRVYKISEVGQSKLSLPSVQKPSLGQGTAEAPGAYHISPDLWDV